MKLWSLSAASLLLAALATSTQTGRAFAEPYVSCSADVCIVSVEEVAPTPVGPGAGAVVISSPSGTYVGSGAWLADVASAFQSGTAYVTTSGADASADQVAGGPLDSWLVIGEEVDTHPDGTTVYTGIYKPGNWANYDFVNVLVTAAPGGVSATGSAVHYEVFGETATTYGVSVSPDRSSVELDAYANGYVLPDGYLEGGVDVESTPDGTTVETTPDLLP